MGCYISSVREKFRYLLCRNACAFLLIFLAAALLAAWPADLLAEGAAPESPATAKEAEPIITREETIETRVGKRSLIRTEAPIADVGVTRPEIADVFVSSAQEMTLSPNSPGVGKVVVRLQNGERISFKIRVYVADPDEFAKKLGEEIGHIQGINVKVLKDKILVEGRVLYLKDMDEIERALGDNPSIINLTSLSSRNARILAREIERELRESAIYGASVEVRDNRVTLVGTLRSERLVKRAERIASSYTPNFDSLLKIAPAAPPKQDRAN